MCERGGGVVDILVRRIIPRSQRNPSSTTTSAGEFFCFYYY